MVHLWLVGKGVFDFLLVLIELFCQLSWLRRYERILVEIVVFEIGGGSLNLSANFRGKMWSSTNDSWCRKTRVPGLSRGVICVIIQMMTPFAAC